MKNARLIARLTSDGDGLVTAAAEIDVTASGRSVLFKPQVKHRQVPNQGFAVPATGAMFGKDSLKFAPVEDRTLG